MRRPLVRSPAPVADLGFVDLPTKSQRAAIVAFLETTASMIDLSGRFYLVYEVETRRDRVGNFSVELAEHFWRSFAEAARCNLHLDCLRGRNTHHILEGTFKAAARALRQATERDARVRGVPSTKGVL